MSVNHRTKKKSMQMKKMIQKKKIKRGRQEQQDNKDIREDLSLTIKNRQMKKSWMTRSLIRELSLKTSSKTSTRSSNT